MALDDETSEKSCNCLPCHFPSLCAKEQRTTVAQRIHWTETYLTGALTESKTSGYLHKAHTVGHRNVTRPVPGFFGSLLLQQSIFVKGETIIQVPLPDPFPPYESARDLLPCTKWIFCGLKGSLSFLPPSSTWLIYFVLPVGHFLCSFSKTFL